MAESTEVKKQGVNMKERRALPVSAEIGRIPSLGAFTSLPTNPNLIVGTCLSPV